MYGQYFGDKYFDGYFGNYVEPPLSTDALPYFGQHYGSTYFGGYFGDLLQDTGPVESFVPPPTDVPAPPSILAQAYARQLANLLPRGAAWSAGMGSWLYRTLQSLAEEMARVHGRALDLMREADPRTTSELLGEWEHMLGLPDPCITGEQTTAQRRAAVLARLTMVGSQSAAFYINVAAKLGYTITISEPAPNVMRVNSPETTVFPFYCGANGCGDRLREWGNEILECAITPLRPAHVALEFAYA